MTQWSTPASVRSRLRKRRWDTGIALTRQARGERFEQIDIPLRGPTAAELGTRYGDVVDWVHEWTHAAGPFTMTTKVVGSRRTGANEIPDRFLIGNFNDLAGFLGTTAQVRRHRELLDLAVAVAPQVYSWVVEKPMRALGHQEHFDRLLACVRWLVDNADRDRYLRQIDVLGVDTKFIERHRAILAELVEVVDDSRALGERPNFAARYGFRDKPARVRIRLLDSHVSPFPGGVTDLELRADELVSLELEIRRVFVVENEVTCLAFPCVPQSMLIFGGGYAVSRVRHLGWLSNVEVYYWGDIDTHGFRILDLLRASLPAAQSMLMDRVTLLAHQAHWDREPAQVNTHLARLHATEAALYRDLVEDTWGPAVRLEQERIRYSSIESAIATVVPAL